MHVSGTTTAATPSPTPLISTLLRPLQKSSPPFKSLRPHGYPATLAQANRGLPVVTMLFEMEHRWGGRLVVEVWGSVLVVRGEGCLRILWSHSGVGWFWRGHDRLWCVEYVGCSSLCVVGSFASKLTITLERILLNWTFKVLLTASIPFENCSRRVSSPYDSLLRVFADFL